MKKIISILLILGFIFVIASYQNNVIAENSGYLDTEEGDETSDTQNVDAFYKLKGVGSGKDGEIIDDDFKDTTKVKVEWVLTDIVVTYSDTKIWDVEKLQWVTNKDNYRANGGTAEFTFTNYGSVNMIAKVSFTAISAVEKTLEETSVTYTNNECVVQTPVTKNYSSKYSDANFTALKETISAQINVDAEKFDKLDDALTSTKFGTYTIKISVEEKKIK